MSCLDYFWYAETFHKIKTKFNGIQPFKLRYYQHRFIDFVENISGPKRIAALKPRQAGFTTGTASFFSYKMMHNELFKVIGLADQYSRTTEMAEIYSDFIELTDPKFIPMVGKNNSKEITFENPTRDREERMKYPGLMSGIKFATANDKKAGRAGSRKGAHMTEAAFYKYTKDIDESIQNSIPLHDDTYVIRESTANGEEGDGRDFYLLYEAAKAGESLYKSFFIPWYEVDDYILSVPNDFEITNFEKDCLKRYEGLTTQHLVWRRLKIMEYLNDTDGSYATMSPQERFKQDFPFTDAEAFRSSGSPVFDKEILAIEIQKKGHGSIINLANKIKLKNDFLNQYIDNLVILSPPRLDRQYYIGVDVSEGLEIGDSSSVCVIDDDMNDVCYWHGKLDPDVLGHLCIGLHDFYNEAWLVIEKNNMGHTTVTTCKNEGCKNLYSSVVEDAKTKKVKVKLGWETNKKTKVQMLNYFIQCFRDGSFRPKSKELLREMKSLSRASDGTVELNGKDRVVAAGLALMGFKHKYIKKKDKTRRSRELYDMGSKKEREGLFG